MGLLTRHLYIAMKQMIVLALMLIGVAADLKAQKILKATLAFKGVQYEEGAWQLCFTDRKAEAWCFDAKHSETAPYVFYSTGADGSLKENEKVKNMWFLVSYAVLTNGKTKEKIITSLNASPNPILNPKHQ